MREDTTKPAAQTQGLFWVGHGDTCLKYQYLAGQGGTEFKANLGYTGRWSQETKPTEGLF